FFKTPAASFLRSDTGTIAGTLAIESTSKSTFDRTTSSQPRQPPVPVRPRLWVHVSFCGLRSWLKIVNRRPRRFCVRVRGSWSFGERSPEPGRTNHGRNHDRTNGKIGA